MAQSVQRLATGWAVRGSNPGADETFRTRPDRPLGPPSLLRSWYGVFPEFKVAGAWHWPHTPPSAMLKKEQCYTYTHLLSSVASSRAYFAFQIFYIAEICQCYMGKIIVVCSKTRIKQFNILGVKVCGTQSDHRDENRYGVATSTFPFAM